jgi:hypothetical protein
MFGFIPESVFTFTRITVRNHPGLAFGIIPESRSLSPGIPSECVGERRRERVEKAAADRKAVLALPIGEEAEMPDAHEAQGEHVQKETPKKLFDAQRHHALLIAMSRIAPAKADPGAFGVDHPRMAAASRC